MLKDEAFLTIDTSGSGLHKRGYRLAQGEAPMKETLAAALVRLTNWKGETPFIDPFCGSGTIAIEACLIAQNIAPGFNRSFASEEWDIIPEGLFEQLRQEADEAADYDKEINLVASDIDPKMVEIAKANADEVGLGTLSNLKYKTFTMFQYQKVQYHGGNPPYERIGERNEVEAMYKHLAKYK